LLAAEITFGGLDRDVAKQELNVPFASAECQSLRVLLSRAAPTTDGGF
jgi:hypothetical protein